MRSSRKLRIDLRPSFALRGWSAVTLRKFNMAGGLHLENGYDVITL